MAINQANLTKTLSDLERGAVNFASKAGLNGLWLQINLDTAAQEIATVQDVRTKLGSRYASLRDALIKTHCGPFGTT